MYSIAKDKGLSELTNDFIYQDSKGFVWISSLEGLNRYDGSHVKVYIPNVNDLNSLNDSDIQSSFFEDKQGDVWFTSLHSIQVYNHKKDNFNKFFIKFKGSVFNKVEYTAFFFEQNRWLWIRAGDSLFRFDTFKSKQLNSNSGKQAESAIEFLHPLQAARCGIDTFSNGKVRQLIACFWAFRRGMEVIDYNENNQLIQRKLYFIGQSTKYPPLTIKKAIYINDTLVWLASSTALVAFNPKNPQLFKLYYPPNLTKIQNIGILPNKEVLVSTSKSELFIFNQKKELFIPLNLESKSRELAQNIMPNGANNIYLNNSNVLWFSIFKKGLLFTSLNPTNFHQVISLENNALNTEQLIENDKRQILAFTLGNQANIVRFTIDKKLINQYNLSSTGKICEDNNGNLWQMAVDGKINMSRRKSLQFNVVNIVDSIQFFDVINLNKNNLLIASNKGLMLFDNNSYKLMPLNGCNTLIHKIFKDKRKRIWLNQNDIKLQCYDIKDNQVGDPLKEIDNISPVNHFSASSNNDSLLWVATAKGVFKINIYTLKDTLISLKDGLPSNFIQAILEDKKGNLWCSTNQGIFKYNPITKQSKLYTKLNGLSSDAYNRGAALLSSTGEMWFGGNNGVDVFHPDSIRDIGHAPQSAIVGLKIFDSYWKGETAIEVAEHITLKHYENTLTLELAAMEYTDPENNLFKVALVAEGDSTKWVDLGTQNHVTFPNLREGRYVFKLLTANSEGIWNKTPKTLVIDITPPYWRTWWFLTLIALATMSLIAYIVYLRLSKVIALQKIRLNLYENLHDDIGSRLTAIVLTVDEIRQKAIVKDLKLERIGTISRNIVANMRRLVWATAPENDALSTVAQQMQTDRRVLLPSGTHFTLKMDKTLENLLIGGDKRYQMLSVFNEALTNIAKYAEATEVETRLEIADEKLIMTIVDNGKGFDPQAPRADSQMSSGHGLRNMERRANRIKGTIAITSKLGEGTGVVFSLPLKDENVWVKFLGIFSKTN